MKKMTKKALSLAVAMCIVGSGVLPRTGMQASRAAESEIDNHLIGYWSFDTSEMTNQASNATKSAELTGTGVSILSNAGVAGGAVHFTKAENSYIKLKQFLDAANDAFTISAWVNLDNDVFSGSNINLFQQGDPGKTILFLNTDKKFGTFMTGTNSMFGNETVELNRWNHIVFTENAGSKQAQVYLNGKLVSTNTLTGTLTSGITDVLIGSHKNGAAAGAIKGDVDELRYYDTVISADTVSALYEQHAAAREIDDLRALVAEAEMLTGQAEEAIREEFQRKLNAAKALTQAEQLPELAELRRVMGELKSVADDVREGAVIDIAVDTKDEKREISDAMFGINHRYHNNAYSSWNASEKKVEDQFNNYVKEADFGSVRYPGGTIANLYDWKKAIGPEKGKTIHGNPFDCSPIDPNFGVDEAMTWIYDDLGSEAIWVYGMAQGSASDAADLFEYLNAPNDGSNPNGGTDWAAVRAENGHEKPYGVTRFEIGNEMGLWGQNYWMDGKAGSRSFGETYVNGGEMTFGRNTKTVREDDWRESAANSDGTAGQVRYVKYDPVKEGSASVYVDGVQWTIVESLENQGTANVCTFDYATGKITFGDGKNGNIPTNGKAITAAYTSIQDGFTEYYRALKDIASQLNMEIEVYSCMEDQNAIEALKNAGNHYDGAVIHPYSETSASGGGYVKIEDNDPEFYEKLLGRSLEHNMTRVQALKDRMGEGKVPVISEFGIYNHNTQFVRSIGHAIYIANEMIDYINMGTPYLNKHCLVDYPYGVDNLGSGSQCVIQAIKNSDGSVDFVSTPSAKAFSIFNHMTGDTEVGQTVTGNTTYYTYQGSYQVPTLKVLSTKDADGNTYVTVVNNRKNSNTNVSISADHRDLTGKEIEIWYLTSENADDENTAAEPDKVDVVKTGVTGDGTSLQYRLAPHSITGFKIPADPVSVPSAHIRVSAEAGGTVSGGGEVEIGSSVTVKAVAEEGYQFAGWYQENVKISEEAEYRFTAEHDMTLNARFVKKETSSKDDPANQEKPGTIIQTPDPDTGNHTTEKPDVTKVVAPQGLKAKKTSKGIRISWKKVRGAKGYIIFRSYKKTKGYKKVATIRNGAKTVYLDKKARKGKLSYYKIRAYQGTVKSAYSKTVMKKR